MNTDDYRGDIAERRKKLEEIEKELTEEKRRERIVAGAWPVDLSNKRCIFRTEHAKPGVRFKIGNGKYQVGEFGNIICLNPKSSRKARHREEVQERKAERERKRRVR